MTNSPPDDRVQLTLRLPPELHERLTRALRGRSLNQDIVERLWQSLETEFLTSIPQSPIRITLDTNGRATSWAEITDIISELTEHLKTPVVALSVEVMTPEIQRAYQRRQDDFNAAGMIPGFTRIDDDEDRPRRPAKRKISEDPLRKRIKKQGDD